MTSFRTAILAMAIIFTGLSAKSQSKAEKIDELMGLYTEYDQFNGSVLVAEQGEVVLQKGYGFANFEWEIPNTPDTRFRLGSITKQFTAMLIMQLVEQHRIDLQANILTYLPDYPKENGERITTHHLLTHTSGIPNYTSFPGFFEKYGQEYYAPDDFVKVFADSTLDFDPGAQFSYSNSGYFLLGVIIEKVSGKTYEQCLHEMIFEPLGMSGSGYDHANTIIEKRAAAYERSGAGYENAPYLDMSIPYAAGSMYSTVEDLFIWDQKLYTNDLLSAESMEQLFAPHIQAWGNNHYAYGWGTGYVKTDPKGDSTLMIGHGGGIHGFNTLIDRLPESKSTIILLNNTGGAALDQMSGSIRAILFDQPYELPKKSAAKEMLSVIQDRGIEAGVARFKEMKSADEYNVSEGEINNVGYILMRSEMINEAIEVFKINVAEFPGSGNVYDSLGEAYLASGNKELAIENYARSVEIDPENENGKRILEELRKE